MRDFAPGRVPAVGSVKSRVSTNGGDKPRWRRDAEELYYIAQDGRVMAASVKTAPVFEAGDPITLFEIRVPKGSSLPFDVASDGRFLVNSLDPPTPDSSAGITVLLNSMAR